MSEPAPEAVDVLIVGAGLSGIGVAHHLQRLAPTERFLILEARDAIGGTWDLFRYPGVRSDSDMHTLGYGFRPWTAGAAIADGAAILDYIRSTADDAGITAHIRFGTRAVRAWWSSHTARWRVEATAPTGETQVFETRFLISCTGYYDYHRPHRPHWPNEEAFAGRFVHPQFWPDDLDWRGRRVAVIGSGATAVTLVPALAREAAHVTMVQRTPSFVVARPALDRLAVGLARILPAAAASRLVRLKNIAVTSFFYRLARRRPSQVRAKLIALAAAEVGGDQAAHFTPPYDPWDQRLCLAPDGDLFATIRDGRASMVTGSIRRFTAGGMEMEDGTQVSADIVVTATGLTLKLGGGMALEVDGRPVDLARTMAYKGVMFGGVPNFASVFGYTNASWTLKADLAAAWLCRLLKRMRRRGADIAVPRPDPTINERAFLDFSSGYILRAAHLLPRAGDRGPWRLPQNYWLDLASLRHGRLEDGVLELKRSGMEDQRGRPRS